MNLIEVAKSRYATKKFDSSKRISEVDFDQIKGLLRFSPSSVNSQPWHFIIADSLEAKKRLTIGTQGAYSANEAKVLDASHVILFCAKTTMSDAYLDRLIENEDHDGRFPTIDSKEMVKKVRGFYADLHRKAPKEDAKDWMEKQVYLNMGTVLLGAGVLGIDAVPIEGIDIEILNEVFGLAETGYSAVAMIALGYRHNEDFNAVLPKSRLPENEIFTFLE